MAYGQNAPSCDPLSYITSVPSDFSLCKTTNLDFGILVLSQSLLVKWLMLKISFVTVNMTKYSVSTNQMTTNAQLTL